MADVDRAERPAAWFTTSDDFEPTARKMVLENGVLRVLSLDEHPPLYRIAVALETVPYTWRDYRRLSGDPSCKRLERAALLQGSDPRRWRLSFDPVAKKDWLSIERFAGKAGWIEWAKGVAA